MNRLQIYTYQRAAEEISFNQRAKRRQANKYQLKLDLKRWIPRGGDIDYSALVKTWARGENLLLIICALVFSRAFVLQEMLPFTFAYIAAFGQRDKNRLIILSLLLPCSFMFLKDGYWYQYHHPGCPGSSPVLCCQVPKGKGMVGIPC